ncbi:hypothetical protein VB773_09005 [Haloarculaceae archaeon H-GB2-1]|nr:hypothetical protein [Haloarculaceae archaeon H-GB1-1]MEA5386185.1 hypothetical protein [Haloarculaceae archaeon H-GB11]MEA5407691.1 hypothetical protein [Haloarculaceae archaeon H-GB2-1]
MAENTSERRSFGEHADDANEFDADTRRAVLRLLETNETAVVTLDALAEDLHTGQPPDDYERRRIRLHHVTLPALASANLLEYDARSHTVRRRETV